jgi:hypothetical protein
MPLDLGNFTSPTLSGSKRKAQAGAVRSNQDFLCDRHDGREDDPHSGIAAPVCDIEKQEPSMTADSPQFLIGTA